MAYVRECVAHLGSSISGNKKFFKFSGTHAWVRKVITKPARIGIWHYQAVCILADGLPFLLYSKPHTGSKVTQTTIPTSSIIEEWINMAVQPPSSGEIETMITVDSYYLSNNGQKMVQERRQPIIASVSEQCFSNLSLFA